MIEQNHILSDVLRLVRHFGYSILNEKDLLKTKKLKSILFNKNVHLVHCSQDNCAKLKLY